MSAQGAVPTSITLNIGDKTEILSSLDIDHLTHLETNNYPLLRHKSTIENIDFCPTKILFCNFSLSQSRLYSFSLITRRTPDAKAIEDYVSTLANKTKQEPVDAHFSVNENKVVITEKEQIGQTLDQQASIRLISYGLIHAEEMTNNIMLPLIIIEPKIKAEDMDKLGLVELIGEGSTNFKGSTKSRIYNIERALKQFQNLIIAPNEEFSFVEHLGEVDGEHGYLPELVIKNNQTTPEFGGGICQVSSTVFRTAIYSGLKITARRNHAYPVHYYYPYGMDATVYIPKPDLTFINNTPASILMQSTIEGTKLTFHFYGTKDGREVKVDGPHILEHNPDGSMKTVFTQEVNNADGRNFIRDSFWSNYKSPSLFPHPGQEPNLTSKPKDWTEKEWVAYKKIHP
ncbi:MAG: hypothetical protein GW815_03225 [Candidatus Moranbacteria bacterium]|nr:hypothetical protein [Candidatus Moranbacteria bacterium]OIQ01890.1 MAG: hypothetical protein AUK58_04010 [Candidatus Moranbacteria bacterium CG2_30_41_165]